jgi:hypothetical protein
MKTIKLLVPLLFLTLINSSVYCQSKVHYTISAEAHALMCPFLSPQLMEKLTKKGAEGIVKNEALQLLFTTSKENELSDELILKLVDDIGYQPSTFSIARTYED